MTDPTPAVPDEATLATIDRWIAYRLWHTRTPGAQVAIGYRGMPFFSRAYGWADLDRQVPMRTDHLFRVASHSKTFTCTLVLQLVEQGRLGLEDRVGTHLSQLDPDGPLAGIAVRELMEHTSGILRDGRDADYWQFDRPFPDAAALLELAEQGGVKAEPGEHFAYSNVAYSLLGLVVEAVTGSTFREAARRGITEPLQLSDTDADYLRDRSGDYAAGHSGLHAAQGRRVLDHVDTNAMAAATGFTSTATDLVSFFGAHAFGDDRLLSDRTKRLQQRRSNDGDPEHPESSGYGWGMVVDTIDGQDFVGHSGGYPGHITKTLLDPTTGLVVSVLTNAVDGPATPLARGIVQLLAAAARPAEGRSPVSPSSERTGRYAGLWGVVDLGVVGPRLLAISPTGWLPLEGADELVEDGDALRISSGVGFGSVGEPVTFDPAAGTLSYAGMTMTAMADLPDGLGYRAGGTATS